MDCGTASSSSVTLSHRGAGDGSMLGTARSCWTQTDPIPDSYPVSFDAHVTFEARETIFTLNNGEGKHHPRCREGEKKKELKFLKPHCTAPAQAEVPTLPTTVASPSPWSAQRGMETHPEPQGTPTVSPNVPCIPSCLQANITNRPNVNNKTVAAQGTNYF